jgi:hypothetical protein
MLLSGAAIVLFVSLLALLLTRVGPVATFVTLIGPVLLGVLGITLLTFLYIGLLVFFGNLREWYGESAGWFEIIALAIIIIIIAGVGFGALAGFLTTLLCVGVVYYIHLIQE